MLIYLPLLVLIIGLLMWVLCTNPILKDMGRMGFAIGLFVLVFRSAGEMVKAL